MKQIADSFSHKLLTVYRIEFVLLLITVALLAGGSLYAVLRNPDSGPLFTVGGGAARGVTDNDALRATDAGTSVFSGIGRLRIPVAGQGGASGATMVLSIAFPYPVNDKPFTEELASRIADFKTIAADYFSSLPAASIAALNEDTAKAELLQRYNALLRLGAIEVLYFSDLMIID